VPVAVVVHPDVVAVAVAGPAVAVAWEQTVASEPQSGTFL